MDKGKNFLPFISVIGIAILFIADLYVIVNNSGNFIVLAIITVLMLLWIALLTNSVIKQNKEQREKDAEQIDELFRGQKANYLQQKKLIEQLAEVKELLMKSSTEDVVTAQKALAKVTISRNKENAEALMNSNDKVIDKMSELYENVERSNSEVASQQKSIVDDYIKGMMEKENEILSNLQAMESALKSEFTQVSDKMNGLVQEVVASVSMPVTPIVEETISEEPELPVMEEMISEEPELPVMEEMVSEEPELPVMEEMISEEPELPVMEEMVSEEPELPVMEELVSEEVEVPAVDESIVLEDTFGFENNLGIDQEAVAKEEARLDSILADVAGMLPDDEQETTVEEDTVNIDSILASIESPVSDELPSLDGLPSLDEISLDSVPTIEEESGLDELPSLDEISLDSVSSIEEESGLDELPSLDEISLDSVPTIEEESGLDELPSLDEISLDSVPLIEEEPGLDELPSLDEISLDSIPSVDETIASEKINDEDLPSLDSILASIPGLEEDLSIEEIPVLDDIKIMDEEEQPLTAEPEVMSEPSISEAIVSETEEKQKEEPTVSDNPNKVMTPDEIAALIANL